jgi:hypothetical protein
MERGEIQRGPPVLESWARKKAQAGETTPSRAVFSEERDTRPETSPPELKTQISWRRRRRALWSLHSREHKRVALLSRHRTHRTPSSPTRCHAGRAAAEAPRVGHVHGGGGEAGVVVVHLHPPRPPSLMTALIRSAKLNPTACRAGEARCSCSCSGAGRGRH